jgi:hypothetical protein
MTMHQITLLVLLTSLLAGCVTTGNDDGLERMERNHRAAVETAA